MRNRFRQRLGSAAKRIDTETVHSFAHGLLRRNGTWIGLPVEPEVLVKDVDRVELLGDSLAARGKVIDSAELLRELRELDRARAVEEDHPLRHVWADALAASGAVDYPAMLERAMELLALDLFRRQIGRMYRHIIIDEAQNLTPVQYRLVTMLLGPPPLAGVGAMMVGEPKQAILRFAGADPACMDRFARRYSARQLRLTCNYRSAERIVRLGERVAAKLDRTITTTVTTSFAAAGEVQVRSFPDEPAEGDAVAGWIDELLQKGLDPAILGRREPTAVAPEQIAVLARTAPAQRETTAALDQRGIEWTSSVNLEELVSTDLGRGVVAVVSLRASDHDAPRWELARLLGVGRKAVADEAALRRHMAAHAKLAGLCARIDVAGPQELMEGLGEVGSDEDPDWHGDRLQLEETWRRFTLEADQHERTWGGFRLFLGRLQRGNELAKGVRVLSIAKAQGREYRAVAVVGLNDGQLPDFRACSEAQRTEELSNFYVAVTRPTRSLLLTRPERRATRYGQRIQDPSPFLHLVTQD